MRNAPIFVRNLPYFTFSEFLKILLGAALVVLVALLLPRLTSIKDRILPPNQCPKNVTVDNLKDIMFNDTMVNVFCPSNITVDNLNDIMFPNETNVVISGIDPNGNQTNLSTTYEGGLNVRLVTPYSAQETLLTDSIWPIFQTNAVYGLNPSQVVFHTFNGGSSQAINSSFMITSASEIFSYATIQSRKRVVHRLGQGTRMEFSALFSLGQLGITQVAGMGTPENGVFFGYINTVFGILRIHHGVREKWLLNITAPTSMADTVTVTLDSIPYMVPVSGSNNIQRLVYELSEFKYDGWKAEPFETFVRFIKDRATPTIGSYSFSGAEAMGDFTLFKQGVLPQQDFTPQGFWNGDNLNGMGPSQVLLDPQKFNKFLISMQYSGTIYIRLFIEQTFGNPAVTRFILVHTITLINQEDVTGFSQASFPFSMAVASFSNLTSPSYIKSGGFAGFIEGQKRLLGPRYSFTNSLEIVANPGMFSLFTVRNSRMRSDGTTNQAVINIVSISAATKHNKPVTIYLIRSGEFFEHLLLGNPYFESYGQFSASLYDTVALNIDTVDNTQLIWNADLPETGNIVREFLYDLDSISLEPGESITLAAATTSGMTGFVSGSLVIREDF